MRLLSSLAGLILLAWSGAACAHAELLGATPAVGTTVAAAPAAMTLTFSESVEPSFSRVVLHGPSGEAVPLGVPHAVPGNAKQIVVELPRLQPGSYKVEWRATSTDTHRTEGRFGFTIAP